MNTATALVALTLSAPGAALALYKCPLPGGGTGFQDMPCEGGSKMNIRADTPSSAATGESARRLQAQTAAIEHRSKIRQAIESRQPLVGMTRAELDSAMGPPSLVNANNYGGKLKDQLIYERQDHTWYVYTEDGVVTSLQHRPAVAVVTQRTGRCPDSIEIKNMETAAASITIGEAERVQRLREIADAKRCR